MHSSRRLAAALAALVSVGIAGAARAKEAAPETQEVRLDFDFAVGNAANAAIIGAEYDWLPQSIDRNDEVPASFRRFVRHPSMLYARFDRNGSSVDAQTSVSVGGLGYLLDGLLAGEARAGLELDDTRFAHPVEDGYWTAPFAIEGRVRPIHALSIGGYYHGRPILSSSTDPSVPNPSQRDGYEDEIGFSVAGVALHNSVGFSATAGLHRADWSFTGYHPGKTSHAGVRVTAAIEFLETRRLAWRIEAWGERANWSDQREGDDNNLEIYYVVGPLQRTVYDAGASLSLVYWYEDRLGLRFDLGGFYNGAPPIWNTGKHGYGQLGFGLVSRF